MKITYIYIFFFRQSIDFQVISLAVDVSKLQREDYLFAALTDGRVCLGGWAIAEGEVCHTTVVIATPITLRSCRSTDHPVLGHLLMAMLVPY